MNLARSSSRALPDGLTLVVWVVWLACFACVLRGIHLYSSPFPRWDDLAWVEAISPDLGMDVTWLWEPHNEHRIPLPRLIGVPIVRAANDIRAVSYFDAALLAGVAAAFIATMRKVRGSAELGDAAFALLLLTPGASAVLLVLQGVSTVVPLALTAAILVLVVARRSAPGPRRSDALASCTLLLPMCGGAGVAAAAVLALGAGALALGLRGSTAEGSRTARALLWAGAAATALVIAAHFVDLGFAAFLPWRHDPAGAALQAWRTLAVGLGPVAADLWPWSGVLVAAFGGGAAWLLGRAWLRVPAERPRTLGLATVCLAMTAVALLIGPTRGASGADAGFEPRNVPPAALWWCAVLFAWLLYAPRRLGRAAGWVLVAVLLACLPANWKFQREDGERRLEVTDTFAADVAQGLGPRELVRRYPASFLQHADVFAAKLRILYDSDMWPALKAHARQRMLGPARERVSPRRIDSDKPLTYRWFEERFVLVGQADHALHCTLYPGAREFTGGFGIHPSSHANPDAADLRVTIELAGPNGGSKVLLERALRPGELEGDRGLQGFSVSLPADPRGAELVLRVARRTTTAEMAPWVYWSGLRVTDAAPHPR